jgi:hypothetical protein
VPGRRPHKRSYVADRSTDIPESTYVSDSLYISDGSYD